MRKRIFRRLIFFGDNYGTEKAAIEIIREMIGKLPEINIDKGLATCVDDEEFYIELFTDFVNLDIEPELEMDDVAQETPAEDVSDGSVIVDDEEMIRKLIRKYAEFEGHTVTEAGDGMEAVMLCRKNSFDLIIMDIMMPELDGFSACREIRKITQTPIIMLTAKGEEIDREHPEWLLSVGESDNKLFDLGNPEARAWITDRVDSIIKASGVKIYRQDFNFDPLPIWKANEAPDRVGFLENRHAMGYLAYWDELVLRNPGLIIDSCASGGRRNDLETIWE